MDKHYIITVGDYRTKEGRYFSLRTPFYRPLNRALLRIGAVWNKELKCWLLTYTAENWRQLQQTVVPFGSLEVVKKTHLPKPIIIDAPESVLTHIKSYQSMLYARGYAQKTIDTYLAMMSPFLTAFPDVSPQELTISMVNDYRSERLFQKSNSSQRQFVGALKLLLQHFENPIDPSLLVRPRKQKQIPKVLAPETILYMISSTQNVKHRLILSMLYACGLRRGELISLEMRDLDFHRMTLHIRDGKFGKDRLLPLPQSIVPIVREYFRFYHPQVYLIEGMPGKLYSGTSISKIVERAGLRAGVVFKVTPHMLRHSYATHLLEKGVDIRFIQELLGHTKPDTTMIYTHVARKSTMSIESPLDTAVRFQQSTNPPDPTNSREAYDRLPTFDNSRPPHEHPGSPSLPMVPAPLSPRGVPPPPTSHPSKPTPPKPTPPKPTTASSQQSQSRTPSNESSNEAPSSGNESDSNS